MSAQTYDIRFFKDYDFTETEVKDKNGNVVGVKLEDGCFCLNNGMVIMPPKEKKPKKPKRFKIKF